MVAVVVAVVAGLAKPFFREREGLVVVVQVVVPPEILTWGPPVKRGRQTQVAAVAATMVVRTLEHLARAEVALLSSDTEASLAQRAARSLKLTDSLSTRSQAPVISRC